MLGLRKNWQPRKDIRNDDDLVIKKSDKKILFNLIEIYASYSALIYMNITWTKAQMSVFEFRVE